MPKARLLLVALAFLSVVAFSGCGDPSGPDPLGPDIRGTYNVEWSVGLNRPDADNVGQDPSLPSGYCPGVVVIAVQTRNSFRGTITASEDHLPLCHASSFDIHGTLVRQQLGESVWWDLLIESDIEPLLGCSYRRKSPGNEGFGFRGAGTAESGGLSLAFGNIYDCVSGRWWIVAGASGTRGVP